MPRASSWPGSVKRSRASCRRERACWASPTARARAVSMPASRRWSCSRSKRLRGRWRACSAASPSVAITPASRPSARGNSPTRTSSTRSRPPTATASGSSRGLGQLPLRPAMVGTALEGHLQILHPPADAVGRAGGELAPIALGDPLQHAGVVVTLAAVADGEHADALIPPEAAPVQFSV